MISFTVRMRFNPEDRTEIENFVRELTPPSRQEPGCASYVPHWVEGEPATLLIYEQYRDEAALEQHRATTHFAHFAVNGLYQKMLDRQLEHLAAIA